MINKNMIQRFVKSKKGQGIVEYGFILFFVAMTVVTILSQLGGKLADFFVLIRNALPG